MRLFTIGFTRTSAESFFTRLQVGGVTSVVDVRLHNVSQLAGFAKRDDLRYFLKSICGLEYVHRLELAPTEDMLDAYRKRHGSWAAYERSKLDAADRDDLISWALYCFTGFGTGGLRGRLDVDDEALLYYCGHFAHFPRSALALECILAAQPGINQETGLLGRQ